MTTTTDKPYPIVQQLDVETVHPISGRIYETGVLNPGTLVRGVDMIEDFDPVSHEECFIYRFEASTDGGESWYSHQSARRPA